MTTWTCPSPYAHLTWLGTWRSVGDAGGVVAVHMRQVNDWLIYTSRGRAEFRWIHRGRERRFVVDAGTVRFAPADNEEHTLIGTCRPGHRFYTLLIPRGHLTTVPRPADGDSAGRLGHSVTHRDPVLTSCVERLARSEAVDDDAVAAGRDEAARRLAARLEEIRGGAAAVRDRDTSVFDAYTMRYFVRHIDRHLTVAPSLCDMALLVGLSPSHFAKKFRASTGVSLHRFVNRRRILAALETLKDPSRPLAHVALDLGFASQSHFTRLFSETTGMTPAKYRKQCRRTLD